jgi:hypothetical protein
MWRNSSPQTPAPPLWFKSKGHMLLRRKSNGHANDMQGQFVATGNRIDPPAHCGIIGADARPNWQEQP